MIALSANKVNEMNCNNIIYSYYAYGLAIKSEIYLPELISKSVAVADIVIRLGTVDPPAELLDSFMSSWAVPGGIGLCWKDLGSLLILHGNEIVVNMLPEAEVSRLRLFILGAAMAVLLHQRGMLVFHASAVAGDDGCAIFLGCKGGGKSTLAAALHNQGLNLVADDVVAVEVCQNQQIRVWPAFPQIKLWPDAITLLGGDPENAPRLSSLFEKRHHQAERGFSLEPIPLHHIFTLKIGSELSINKVNPRDSILELMLNLYPLRFKEQLLATAEKKCFLMCGAVANRVHVLNLQRPSNINLLPETAAFVKNFIAD